MDTKGSPTNIEVDEQRRPKTPSNNPVPRPPNRLLKHLDASPRDLIQKKA